MFGGCRSVWGRVHSSPAWASRACPTAGSGLPSAPPPTGGRPCPDAAALPGSGCREPPCITAVGAKPHPSARGPRRRLCVCAPGLNALEPSPQEQSGGPALATPEGLPRPSDVDRALVRTGRSSPVPDAPSPHTSPGCWNHAPVILNPHALARAYSSGMQGRRRPPRAGLLVHRS